MNTCVQNDSIIVTGCDCTTDWKANPGACRLRLTAASYHDGILVPCHDATPSILPPWDGTMPVWTGAQYLSAANAPTIYSISGGKFTGCNLFFSAGVWSLGVAGDSFGVGNAMWIGTLANACPIGVYTFLTGCTPQIANLALEAYAP